MPANTRLMMLSTGASETLTPGYRERYTGPVKGGVEKSDHHAQPKEAGNIQRGGIADYDILGLEINPRSQSTPGASERRRAPGVRHSPEAIYEDETDVPTILYKNDAKNLFFNKSLKSIQYL